MPRLKFCMILLWIVAVLFFLNSFASDPYVQISASFDDQRPKSKLHDILESSGPISPAFKPPYGDQTLGVFQRIWIITLETRQDRQDHMRALAEALNLSFTYHFARDPYHNATDRQTLEDVANFVLWERHQVEYKDPPITDTLTRLFPFEWSEDAQPGSIARLRPDDIQGADLWLLPDSDPRKPTIPSSFPRYILSSDENGHLDQTKGEKPPFVVWQDNALVEGIDTRLDPPITACWLSHYEVLRKIAESEDEGPQLIFEDDVDFEWDLQQRLYQILPKVPGWEVLFLGHCFSDGAMNPIVNGMPYLHQPSHIMCTHAYAITPSAARKLVRYLRSPLFAFSRPIDHVFNFIGDLEKYSIEPPVSIQVPKTLLGSDIGTADNAERMQYLVDGVFQRILRAKEMGGL
ncbi:hypothetical protein BT96DRAFT_563797 [Gymnopus androsaceus JB14]|uniref:Glycosyl transferase family 25 domain-containing protein n=1 Tax=Gymnopus androsaceus JB14 TaxID=1447944 RepID=A0A6A4HUU2_9AGAR|nr:hypothetical protein BT96DRAFT_563797 [Gymnopus androsaceus JB14]